MVQLGLAIRGTRRTALVLYGLLLVLPTFVLGGLHWRQLVLDHQALVDAVPNDVADAARRLEDALARRVRELLDREDTRPFWHYRHASFEPGTIGTEIALVPTPLERGPAPASVVAWFAYERGEAARRPPDVFLGGRTTLPESERRGDDLGAAARGVMDRDLRESFFVRIFRPRRFRTEEIALPVAAINLSREENIECLQDEIQSLRAMENERVSVDMTDFRLRFHREADGTPRVIAVRTVYLPPSEALTTLPQCFEALGRDVVLRQGFFIDPVWLFEDLPRVLAAQVLLPTQELILPGAGAHTPPPGSEVSTIRPLKALSIEAPTREDESFATLAVVTSTLDLERRFQSQMARFFGVAAMLVISLATGMWLLLRSVNRDLEAARRTENFVAAVTHELRTPLAAIKLYGEMLEAGWADDPQKRAEYYRRIVRETGRLETLVERVLEKSQLARRDVKPEPGDLNDAVDAIVQSVAPLAPEGVVDLEVAFADDLPLVMLVPEGLRSIVTNLVENARKYAPVAAGGEPIVVATEPCARGAALEVRDRGPGIPARERERIFEAFYRIGDERTRQSRGTGLGLHLVALQANAMGATVEVRERTGGGTVFRVEFTRAAEPS